MKPVVVRRNVCEVKSGDRFQHDSGIREVVRLRAFTVTLPDERGVLAAAPGVEVMHKNPSHPGVRYLYLPLGSQLPIVIS